MKANRRPPETGIRQSRDGQKTRMQIVIPAAWMRLIAKAARQQNLGRSNFIAAAAHAAAQKQLEKEKIA